LKTQKTLIPLLERLCKLLEQNNHAMEGLHADLRPELHRTETMKRLKQEKDDLQNEIGEAVRKFKA
jgi:hypothetical protein|tara:strand:+ start:406 stop:603 length:198 start_codon:yes stop_codon:yes gene_type:complete